MKAVDALDEFDKFLKSREISVGELSSHDAINSMMEFYMQVRTEECDIDADGDMLLFQWGTHDWGQGESFEYDITRQLIIPMEFEDEEESWVEDAMWQLSLRLKYTPSSELKDLGSGNQWCHSPSDVTEFAEFVQNTKATQMVRQLGAKSVSLEYFQV